MNLYCDLINDTIDYIEENISEQMALEDISKQFCISEYHFNRLFKTVVGKSLKQYILGRKLTLALERLRTSGDSIINIAYDFGFEYPEVFSRAFKKQFGIAPLIYRNQKVGVELVEKAKVVEREIVNYQGVLTVKGFFVYLENLYLKGRFVEVNESSEDFKFLLQSTGEGFLCASQDVDYFKQEMFYCVVNCHGEDNGLYTVFYGKETTVDVDNNCFESRQVPEGWYVCFSYHGDMFEIREAFIDDLYRWIMVKEIEFNSNGVGMLNVFEKDYLQTQDVQILVPIKNPK